MLYNGTEIDEGLLKIASAAKTTEEWEARMAGAVAGVALFRSLVKGKLERDRAQSQPDTISHWILDRKLLESARRELLAEAQAGGC